MRLLQLSTGPGELLDLHPQVTVVHGVDGPARELLVSAVAGLGRGRAVGAGLVEAHGVLFELDDDLLGLLDLREGEVDPVIRPADLPTQPLTVDARELRRREDDFREVLARISDQVEREAKARDAVAAAAAAVAAARAARAEADTGAGQRVGMIDEATATLDRMAEQERARRDDLAVRQAEQREAAAAHDAARSRLARAEEAALAAGARLGAAREQLAALDGRAELEAQLEVARAAVERLRSEEGPAAVVDASQRIAEVEHRLGLLEHLVASVSGSGSSEVADALAAVVQSRAEDGVPSPEALALADELDAAAEDAGAGIDDAVGADDVTDARARLEAAEAALLEAEQALRDRRHLAPAEGAEIEAAHEALLDAVERADRRFAGARARATVDEARAAEQAVLARFGFASYTDYVMGMSSRDPDPARQEAVEGARAELEQARLAWAAIQRGSELALRRATAQDRLRRLQDEARPLLDADPVDGDWSAALRALRVPRSGEDGSGAALQKALTEAGLELGEDPVELDELVELAEAWRTELADQDVRREGYEREQAELRRELEELEPGSGDQARQTDALAEAEAELAALLDRQAEGTPTGSEDDLRGVLVVAEEAAARAEEERADAARAADEAAATLVAALEALGEAEQALEAAEGAAAAARHALSELAAEPADPTELEARIEAAEASHREALAELEAESEALARLDAEGQAAALEVERLQDIVAAQGDGEPTPASEIEWYLLARVASQRSVSVAGSLPLLLDDALGGVHEDDLVPLLGRLERMADSVQLIILSDDPSVAVWAEAAGPARAAVVAPGPA